MLRFWLWNSFLLHIWYTWPGFSSLMHYHLLSKVKQNPLQMYKSRTFMSVMWVQLSRHRYSSIYGLDKQWSAEPSWQRGNSWAYKGHGIHCFQINKTFRPNKAFFSCTKQNNIIWLRSHPLWHISDIVRLSILNSLTPSVRTAWVPLVYIHVTVNVVLSVETCRKHWNHNLYK